MGHDASPTATPISPADAPGSIAFNGLPDDEPRTDNATRPTAGRDITPAVTPASTVPQSFVLYDGECPICRQYMALSALRTVRADIAVIDARAHLDLVASLRSGGFEVNDSIIVRLAGKNGDPPTTFMGGDATRIIHDLAGGNGAARKLALWVIGGAPWRHVLYPYLRGTRNLLLRIAGKPLVP